MFTRRGRRFVTSSAVAAARPRKRRDRVFVLTVSIPLFVNRAWRAHNANMTTNTNGPHAKAADWKDSLAKRTACRGANVLRLNSSDERTAALVDAPVGPTSIDEERRCALPL